MDNTTTCRQFHELISAGLDGCAECRAIASAFGPAVPQLMAEPGRYPVADVETLHTEVMLVGNRDIDARLWVHVGCGVFGGLAETRGESMVDIVLAGPTCDSADIVYETAGYRSPASLAPGDVVRIASTGAYTAGYSAIGFNGFAPLRQVHDACQLPKSNPRSGALSIGR